MPLTIEPASKRPDLPTPQFATGDAVTREYLYNGEPKRVTGKVTRATSVNRVGTVYEFRPDGFEWLTMEVPESELRRAPNPITQANLKKKNG